MEPAFALTHEKVREEPVNGAEQLHALDDLPSLGTLKPQGSFMNELEKEQHRTAAIMNRVVNSASITCINQQTDTRPATFFKPHRATTQKLEQPAHEDEAVASLPASVKHAAYVVKYGKYYMHA